MAPSTNSDFNLQTDDLVLFFSGQDAQGQPAILNRWLPKAVYTDPNLKLEAEVLDAAAPGWRGIVVAEVDTKGATPWYLANFSRTKIPGDLSPATMPKEVTHTVREAIAAGAHAPQPNDLVIVPYTAAGTPPDGGYVVTRDIYQACPELPPELVADLQFMVVSEGVVFANVPKLEVVGISCELLGLSNLRSGTLPDLRNASKTEAARTENNKMQLATLLRSDALRGAAE
jgi:hypothetical protein